MAKRHRGRRMTKVAKERLVFEKQRRHSAIKAAKEDKRRQWRAGSAVVYRDTRG